MQCLSGVAARDQQSHFGGLTAIWAELGKAAAAALRRLQSSLPAAVNAQREIKVARQLARSVAAVRVL
jgi:hypothetical protein